MLLLKLILFNAVVMSTTGKLFTSESLNKVPAPNFSDANAKKSDVFLELYSNKYPDGVRLDGEEWYRKLDERLPTKLFIHGFMSNISSSWFKIYKDAYQKNGQHNIIFVDWSGANGSPYHVAMANCKPVGEFIADYLIESRLSPENIHIIGHSLGAHLAGFVGKSYQEKSKKNIGRITGLDAGNPGFQYAPSKEKLNKSDADFVDVIHTDIDYYGYKKPLGHVDFYPNGGRDQPGCSPDDDNCNHARSTQYFGITIHNEREWKACKAFLLDDLSIKLDKDDPREIVFGDKTPHTARGVYYVKIDLL